MKPYYEPNAADAYLPPCCRLIILQHETDILGNSAQGSLEDYNYEDLF